MSSDVRALPHHTHTTRSAITDRVIAGRAGHQLVDLREEKWKIERYLAREREREGERERERERERLIHLDIEYPGTATDNGNVINSVRTQPPSRPLPQRRRKKKVCFSFPPNHRPFRLGVCCEWACCCEWGVCVRGV